MRSEPHVSNLIIPSEKGQFTSIGDLKQTRGIITAKLNVAAKTTSLIFGSDYNLHDEPTQSTDLLDSLFYPVMYCVST